MNELEIIRLRPSAELPDHVLSHIRSATNTIGDGWRVWIYRQHGEMADISVHIRRGNSASHEIRSLLGENIAQELKQYGVVEYTYWSQM